MPISDVFLYFLSFYAIPIFVLSAQSLDNNRLNAIFRALFIGGILFSILAVSYYGRFIGQLERLSSSIVDEAVLSPISLSYSSTILIGVSVFYLIFNEVSFLRKIMLYTGIGLATIPFFLGASRGSLIALIIPFILYLFSGKSINFKFRALVTLSVIIIGVAYLDQYFSSGLLNRFFGISEAIENNDSSANRTQIWESSLNQFINSPIFGDKLRVNFSSGYAHNIFIEVLQTTGVLGFVPFVIIIFNGWRACFSILKHRKDIFWVAVIFIQSFMMNMFSGAVYTAAWLWTSLGVLIALKRNLHRNNFKTKEII